MLSILHVYPYPYPSPPLVAKRVRTFSEHYKSHKVGGVVLRVELKQFLTYIQAKLLGPGL